MIRKFTRDHEWLDLDGDVATVGVTRFAEGQLGDVVFVEMPELGRRVETGDAAAVVESVKAASDIYAPIGGEIVAVNDALKDDPAMINADAEGDAWIFKLRVGPDADLAGLLDRAAYDELIA